jgi:hypothetical protein
MWNRLLWQGWFIVEEERTNLRDRRDIDREGYDSRRPTRTVIAPDSSRGNSHQYASDVKCRLPGD